MRLFRRAKRVESSGRSDPADMNVPDNWHGGYYELSIKLGAADDQRLDRAVTAMWSAAGFGAAFRRSTDQPWSWEPGTVSASAVLEGHIGTLADVPGLGQCVCAVMVVREERDQDGQTVLGADWLDLCLPLGALSSLDPRVGGFPFGDASESRAWREPIEDWFSTIASAVFDQVPFAHAVTGNEVSGVELDEPEPGYVGLIHPDAATGAPLRTRIAHW